MVCVSCSANLLKVSPPTVSWDIRLFQSLLPPPLLSYRRVQSFRFLLCYSRCKAYTPSSEAHKGKGKRRRVPFFSTAALSERISQGSHPAIAIVERRDTTAGQGSLKIILRTMKGMEKPEHQDVDFYSIKVLDSTGSDFPLSKYRNRHILIINVASKCSFAKQYEGLEKIHKTYSPRGLVVLGFPCNQFANQSPGTAQEESDFCTSQYGVTFPILQKLKVNGSDEHPLYTFLKSKKPGLLGIRMVKWNFEKFLVGPDGNVIQRYSSMTTPKTIGEQLETILPPPELASSSIMGESKGESLDLLPPVNVDVSVGGNDLGK